VSGKAVLFGLSGFGNTALRALRRAGFDVGLVLTRKETGPFPYYEERTLADEARALGLEVLESPDLGDKALKARIDAYAPDLLLAATFSVPVPHRFLGVAGRTCLGIHPSLLPAYRGATPTTWMTINQEPQMSGVTLHHLTPKAFVGDIALQRKVEVQPRDTDGTLRNRLAEVAGELVFEAASAIARGEALARTPQDETKITFFPPRTRRDGLIKFDEPTRNIFDRIRAVLPHPGAFTYWGDREVEILAADQEETGTFEVQPGLVMRRAGEWLVVKTHDGALRVKTRPALGAEDLERELVVFTDHHRIGIPKKKGLRDTIVHTRETYGIEPGAEEFPKMVVLATVYPCNAKCPNCPYTEGNSDIRMKYADAPFVDPALFKKIADECGQYGSFVRITGGGEPMMHPADMVSLIEYARSVGARVWLNTNGSLMPSDKVDRLLACGLDQIEFSVDAADPQTYEIVRAGLDWDKLLETVRYMVAERNRRKSTTNIVVSVINQDIVRDSMDQIVRFWLDQGVDEVIKRKFLTWGSNTAIDANYSADPTPYLDKTEGEPCPYPFHRLNVDSRGKVEVCGFDISGRTNLGNVREQTIHEIWKGPMFEWWRAKHAARQGGDIPLCRECPDWQYRSWTHNWEKVMRTAKAHRLRVIEWAEHETDAPGAAPAPGEAGPPAS
jgi:methionyl-tRNA formyltransferase/MoaA/NifB/PqqE/SkfB family radical SAM enzyme